MQSLVFLAFWLEHSKQACQKDTHKILVPPNKTDLSFWEMMLTYVINGIQIFF